MFMSVVALQRWLWFVAALRFLSVVIGFAFPNKFKTTLFDGRPDYVNPLLGRLFGTWTSLTCVLCIICSQNLSDPAIYGATLISFIVALLFFLSECFVFKTVSSRAVISPMVVASISTVWMTIGWTTYVQQR